MGFVQRVTLIALEKAPVCLSVNAEAVGDETVAVEVSLRQLAC